MRRSLVAVMLLFVLGPAWAAVQGKAVQYQVGDSVFKGYLAYNDAFQGKRPGVLVVHEWWGQNEHARRAARKLAQAGYVALAVDMYGNGKVVDNPKDAGTLSGEVSKNLPLMKQRFDAARDVLTSQSRVDPARLAAIGFCFGGGVVLNMARQGEDLRGVVSFHGSLGTSSPAQKGSVKGKLLILAGTADKFVDRAAVAGFEQEMKAADVNYKLVRYPGAQHAFTNPEATALGKKFNLPIAYDAAADKKSWIEAQAFLKGVLK